MNKEYLSFAFALLFFFVAIVFTVYNAINWYGLPCKDLKTHWLLKNGQAPARCIGE